MKRALLASALFSLSLAACDDSTGVSGTICGEGNSSTASGTSCSSGGTTSRFQVVDTVIGTWVSTNGVWEGDTVVISKDSLHWKHSSGGLYPTKLGAKFYAYGGNMGLTIGQGTDNVFYEYLKSGDTLWLEMQNLSDRPYDGRVDRSLYSTFALLPLR